MTLVKMVQVHKSLLTLIILAGMAGDLTWYLNGKPAWLKRLPGASTEDGFKVSLAGAVGVHYELKWSYFFELAGY